MLTLNRVYETDISVSVLVTNVPADVALEDGGYIPAEVAVSGEGTELIGYHFKDALTVSVDYSEFVRNGERLVMPASALRTQIVERLGSTLSLKGIVTDSLVAYVQRESAVVPVKKGNLELKPAPGYELIAVNYEPEEVRVTALIDEISDIKEISTPSLYCDGLAGDTILELTFLPGRYIDVSPERVQVHVDVAQYVNRVVSVPVEYVKFPSEIDLDFLPRDVDVMYEVLDAKEDKVRPSDFSVQLRFEDCSYSVMLRTVQVLEDKFTVSTSSSLVRNVSLKDIQSPDSLNSNLLDFAL